MTLTTDDLWLQWDNIQKTLLKVISNLSKRCCTEVERSKADTVTQTETEAAITNSSHGILLTRDNIDGNGRDINEKGFGGGGCCCRFYSKRSPCLLYTDKGLINKQS